jgi:HlyD family secretion protein/epimerase transport system membrane fusion protein
MRLLPKPDRLDLAECLPAVSVPMRLRGPALLGLAAIFAAVGCFGVWAATAPLASAVVAAGKLIVASKRKQVQHLEGGIIERVAVTDGQHVAAGDVLIELDVTRSKSRFAMARMGYVAAAAAETRLSAERDAKSNVEFTPDLLAEARSDAEVASVLKNQRQIFAARQLEYAGQTQILEQRMKRLEDEVSGLDSERAASEQQLALAIEEHATLEALYKKSLTTRQRVLALAREVVQLKGQIGRLTSRIAATHKEISETELNLAQTRMRRSSEVLAELRDVQGKMLDFRQQYAAYRNELERTVARAPVSGTVVGLQVHTVGGVVRSGETLLEIVPDRDQLVVEIKVRPMDVHNVRIGHRTQVRFSAFKQRSTPTLTGHVATISADALTDPRSSEPYYLAEIEVDVAELSRLGHVTLQPGMPCEVMIETGERTALAYLLEPLADSFRRAWRER